MTAEQERMRILEMIESGQLSASEGLRLLQALNLGEDDPGSGGFEPEELPAPQAFSAGSSTAAIPLSPETAIQLPATRGENGSHASFETFAGLPAAPSRTESVQPEVFPPAASGLPGSWKKWPRWWLVPLWMGVGVTVFGALLLFWVLQVAGVGFWFFFASLPFLLGLGIILLAYASRTAPWFHLRVTQRAGAAPEHLSFSFPLPLSSAGWVLRKFGRRIPGMQGQDLEPMLAALKQNLSADNPLYIEVGEGDGEHVEIYIG